jgi:hypothetical protein
MISMSLPDGFGSGGDCRPVDLDEPLADISGFIRFRGILPVDGREKKVGADKYFRHDEILPWSGVLQAS